MAINYVVAKTGLPGKGAYVGKVSLKGSYDREMLLERMLEMGTSLSREDIEGGLSLLEKAVFNICKEGNKVTLSNFMQFTPAIGGSFDGSTAGFDRSIHDIYVTAQISPSYNRSFRNEASVERLMTSEKKPYLLEVEDNETGNINAEITVKNIVTIYGEQMKFDPHDAEEYLRFVNEANPSEFVPVAKCQKTSDKEIVFLMPDVSYARGYFELGCKMNTKTVRAAKSRTVDVKR